MKGLRNCFIQFCNEKNRFQIGHLFCVLGSAEVLAVILVLYSSNLFLAIKGDYPSHWVQPDVWSRSNNVKNVHNLADQEGPCPVCETCPAHTIGNHENIAVFDSQQSSTDFRPNENECNANEEHGHFLFKKLANFLLDRKQFKVLTI